MVLIGLLRVRCQERLNNPRARYTQSLLLILPAKVLPLYVCSYLARLGVNKSIGSLKGYLFLFTYRTSCFYIYVIRDPRGWVFKYTPIIPYEKSEVLYPVVAMAVIPISFLHPFIVLSVFSVPSCGMIYEWFR